MNVYDYIETNKIDFPLSQLNSGNWAFANDEKLQIQQKIEAQGKPLKEWDVEINYGVKPYEVGKGTPSQTKEIEMKKPFTSLNKDDESFLPLVGGSDFEKYYLRWNQNNWISYGEWLAAPRDKSIFEQDEKIIVRQTSDSIVATLIKKNFIIRNNTHLILKKSNLNFLNLKNLLGLLNSKLFDFLYWSINPERGEALPEVKAFHLYKFPLIDSGKYLSSIEEKVNKILKLKEADPQADISYFEKEIDLMVYKLYGLTTEEAKIIDPALTDSELALIGGIE